MPPRIDSSISPSPPLTLKRTMAVIAALALNFASLPIPLSVMLAVAVVGILVLQGLRLPLITDGGGVRRWLPWMIWALALAACPIAISIVGNLYVYTGPPICSEPRPWAYHAAGELFGAHLVISVVASVAVVVLTRGPYRWSAWAAILAIDIFAAFIWLGAAMQTTNCWL